MINNVSYLVISMDHL